MDNDDAPVGRVLTRREVLVLMGGAGLALLAGCSDDDKAGATPTREATNGPAATAAATQPSAAATTGTVPSCVVVPELTEGPYFVDDMLDRSDIRSDPGTGEVSAGTQYDLTVNVSQISSGSCTPLANAMVDVWHCDAAGQYSGFVDTATNFDTTGQAFLRGFQRTDASGAAKFTTIYPGWYQGRATHIHFKIRTADADGGPGYEFTSQWFFDEAVNDAVYATSPYVEKGSGRMLNAEDGIYNQGGSELLLTVEPAGGGYASVFDIALQV